MVCLHNNDLRSIDAFLPLFAEAQLDSAFVEALYKTLLGFANRDDIKSGPPIDLVSFDIVLGSALPFKFATCSCPSLTARPSFGCSSVSSMPPLHTFPPRNYSS